MTQRRRQPQLLELPDLSQLQADALRAYVKKVLRLRACLKPALCEDLAVLIVAQFPMRVARG